jgi:hypothetical protein
MGQVAKVTLCAVVGVALLSIEANAQSTTKNFRQGAPGEYHVFRPQRFEPSQQPTQPRQVAPQKSAPQAPYNNSHGARPSRY